MNQNGGRLIIGFLALFLLVLPSLSIGKTDQAIEGKIETNLKYNGVPRSLRPLLVHRLQLFVDYQRTEQWDKMAELLVDFHFGETRRQKVKYTEDEKNQTVDIIKKQGIEDFKPQQIIFSTLNLSSPLSRQEWDVFGCAEYELNGRPVKGMAQIRVYCQNRKWVFGYFELHLDRERSIPTPCENAWYNKSNK